MLLTASCATQPARRPTVAPGVPLEVVRVNADFPPASERYLFETTSGDVLARCATNSREASTILVCHPAMLPPNTRVRARIRVEWSDEAIVIDRVFSVPADSSYVSLTVDPRAPSSTRVDVGRTASFAGARLVWADEEWLLVNDSSSVLVPRARSSFAASVETRSPTGWTEAALTSDSCGLRAFDLDRLQVARGQSVRLADPVGTRPRLGAQLESNAESRVRTSVAVLRRAESDEGGDVPIGFGDEAQRPGFFVLDAYDLFGTPAHAERWVDGWPSPP
jgi:hypothetical protein